MPEKILRNVVIVLLLTLCTANAAAQDSLYMRGNDTLRYTYTPVEYTPIEYSTDTVKQKNSIFRRFVRYFEESSIDKSFEKKIDFSFAGGPSYSKNTSFGIGVIAAGLYRIDRTDSAAQPSNISIFATGSISGFYAVGVGGNHIFSKNRNRIDYELSFSSAPRSLWGRGYDAGAYNPESTYIEKHYQVQAKYKRELFKSMFLGCVIDFEHTKGIKFTELDYLYGDKQHYTSTGLGLVAEYDSRDFIPNPYKGVYVSLQGMIYPKGLGNAANTVWRTTFVADYYRKVWKGGVIAADLYAEFNSQDAPWTLLARMGGSYRMRGYYLGRYTDNNIITVQVELRQKIYRRIGCTIWGGAGNVFSTLSDYKWSQTLPNYGVGLRWEFKKRINVRIDYGFGRKTSGFLLNINEAF